MKLKTDLYTRIMLTAIVILLAAHLIKDINFVSKANAAPAIQNGEIIDVNIKKINGYSFYGSDLPVDCD